MYNLLYRTKQRKLIFSREDKTYRYYFVLDITRVGCTENEKNERSIRHVHFDWTWRNARTLGQFDSGRLSTG